MSARMQVVFLTPAGQLGGAERSLLDVVAVLRQLRPDWPLGVIVGEEGPLAAELRRWQAAVAVLPWPETVARLGESFWLWSGQGTWRQRATWSYALLQAAAALPAYRRRLRRQLFQWRPRLLHSNGLKCHLLARGAAPPGCAVLWHLRDFLARRPVLGRTLPYLARPPQRIIAISQAVAEDARRLFPQAAIETIYNGIDTEHFTPLGPALNWDAVLGGVSLPSAAVRVGLVATYARWKGQEVFLEAAARLRAAGVRHARFFLIGGPIYRTAGSQFSAEELRQRIATLGLTGYCHLVPFQTDLPPVYRGLDIVVHASTQPEPFGRTIAEAMACGRAVIVSRTAGAAELITDGVDALSVPPGDARSLAAALHRLIQEGELRQRLGQAARQTALRRFDRQLLGQRLLQVYQALRRPAEGVSA
jgi:glycosyltransferase involved in cell wall biosynthesis